MSKPEIDTGAKQEAMREDLEGEVKFFFWGNCM